MKGRRIAIAVTVIGAVLLVIAAATAVAEFRYLSTARHASGLIVDMQQGGSGSSQPVVRFTATEGAQIEFQSNLSSSSDRIGQEVAVTYDPSDPKGTAAIDDPVGNYLVSMVAGAFGAIVLLIGLGMVGVLRLPRRVSSMPMPRLSPKLIAPILLLVGLLLAAGALAAVNSALSWQPSTADGVVADFAVDDQSNQYPVVRFSVDGRLHTVRSMTGSNPTPYHVGQQVTVYYDPRIPVVRTSIASEVRDCWPWCWAAWRQGPSCSPGSPVGCSPTEALEGELATLGVLRI